jgi:hypothetical protein
MPIITTVIGYLTLENTEGAFKNGQSRDIWQHRANKTTKNKTKTPHNMCWTPLQINKRNQDTSSSTGGKDESNILKELLVPCCHIHHDHSDYTTDFGCIRVAQSLL